MTRGLDGNDPQTPELRRELSRSQPFVLKIDRECYARFGPARCERKSSGAMIFGNVWKARFNAHSDGYSVVGSLGMWV